VSTEDQAERQTVAAQTEFLRRYCDLHSLPVAGIYVDDGISGATPLEDRPEGRRLLGDAEAGAFTVVLVYRLDRLGRSLKSLLDAHDRLERLGVSIRSGTEPFDTASPIGRFLFSLLASMAELERATINERMTGGRDRVARQGQYTGGPIPFGYDLDEARRLVPSSRIVEQLSITEAELVRDIFSRIADGDSTMAAECRRLNSAGVPRVIRYGGRRQRTIDRAGWSHTALTTILHNPLYRGADIVASRNGDVSRPTEALVGPAVWGRAQQAALAARRMSSRPDDRTYHLRGLVRCGLCNQAYVGGTRGSNRDIRLYRCRGQVGAVTEAMAAHGRCQAVVVDANRLEAAVWGEVRAFIEHPGPYIEQAQRELRARMSDASQNETRRQALARELAGKEQERERVLSLFRRGRITSAEAERELDAVATESAQLREMLDAMRVRAEMAAASEGYLADVGAALAQMQGNLDQIERTDDWRARRELISLLAPSITVETQFLGLAKVRQRKQAVVKLALAFHAEYATVYVTPSCGTICSGESGASGGRGSPSAPSRRWTSPSGT
jgi:site-specific DNA recombinase